MHRLRPGCRGRDRARLTNWLLVRGRGERPLPATGFTLERHSSSKRPSVQAGELAVCYAAVWQAVFAVVEVASEPEEDPERTRWRWSFRLRPLIALRSLEDAVPAEEVGIFPSSLWRHSHIRLTDDQFDRARAAIATAIVRVGYDAIAERYAAWAGSFASPVGSWVERLLERVPPRSRFLDLGCGNGSVSRILVADGHDVVGVDVSREQLRRAAEAVPEMALVHADALAADLPPASFDAVVSTFVFGHVPRAQQPVLLRRVHDWLRPGGWALVTLGTADAEDEVEPDWLGAPMFFASFDEATNRALVTEAGLEVVEARVVPFEEQGHGVVRFMWVLARRPE